MPRQHDSPGTTLADRDDDIRLPDIEELERQFAGTPSEVPVTTAFTNATLSVTRNAANDVQDRAVTLWLDDERWDVLRYGQTLTRTVPPGRHVVKGHNTLIATRFEFEAAPGEHVRLRCANTVARGGALLMLLIGWAMLRVRIEREPPIVHRTAD
jgi:hypothetical protein